ncbi:LEA domain protein [Apiospora marii]|uniref:LEA domain protein n=1 Tax=Apiospora marii TaxID=335849 RepID=A0ABR1S5U1_9PEZI
MSFLTKTVTSRMAMTSRSVMTQAPRSFSVAARLQKNPVEATKDTLKQADRTVSDKIVDGIDAAQNAASKAKDTNIAGKVKGTAEQVKGQAAGKTEELKGKASGKSEELKGEAKGTAQEAAGKAKGAADKL